LYKVTIINDDEKIVIHSPVVGELKLPSGVIKKAINAIDSFTFSFNLNNPGYGKMKPLKTLVNILNKKTGKYEFEGRVLGPNEQMDTNGLISTTYVCEGELAYLHDSQQRHLEFRGTPKALLQSIISYHNQQVEEYKRFEVGEVTVTNSTNNLYLYLSAEKDTYDTIKEKLIDTIGGELQIRKENGVRFLDWLVKIGVESNTEIKIAKNLISMSRDVDPTTIVTRLTPLGTRIESTEEGATDASEARLTIESVNNGVPYIDNEALKEEFGIQGGSVTWDDVTIASNLLTKGQGWINNQKTSLNQYQLSALDLFLIGLDLESFYVGNSHKVINPIMSINERLRVIGKSIDINNPQNATLTIGDKFKTLNEYQSDLNKSAQQVNELRNTVTSQTNRIGTISTELTEAMQELESTKQTLEATQQQLENFENITDDDLATIASSINNLLNVIETIEDQLGDIPVYAPATTTTDGLMSSSDKVKINGLQNYTVATTTTDGLMSKTDKTKLDGLQNYSVATTTTDGLMSKTDKEKVNKITVLNNIDLDVLKEKLDLITVLNAVDLDDLVARVEALESPEPPEEGGE
jgi:signal transduction histidine kinase